MAETPIPAGGDYPVACNNRLASAAEKQDVSRVHNATAGNASQELSVSAALLAGPGLKESSVSQGMKIRTTLMSFWSISASFPV